MWSPLFSYAKQSKAKPAIIIWWFWETMWPFIFFFSVKICFIYKIRFIRFIILLTIAIIPLILRNVINKPTNNWMNILGPEFPIVWRKIKSHWDLSQTFWQIQIQSSKHLIRFQFPKLVHIYTRYRDRCRASFSHIIIIISIISH